MNLNVDKDWLLRMADVEANGSIAAGSSFGTYTNTATMAHVTVDSLLALMRSIPKPPPLPQKFHDAVGRCCAAIVRHHAFPSPSWHEVKVANAEIATRLKAEAEAGGDRLAIEVDPTIALPHWPDVVPRRFDNPFAWDGDYEE
jgi:hypothetical protein